MDSPARNGPQRFVPAHRRFVPAHRRLLPRAVLRRWERGIWVLAGAVLVALAAVLSSGWRPPAPGSSVVSSVPSAPTVSPTAGTGTDLGASDCFLPACDQPTLSGPPTLLYIPSIGVITTLESLDLDTTGQLEPPKDYAKAGWWAQGIAPGDPGPAVIAGHVDSAAQGPAVFFRLHALVPGATVEVQRSGHTIVFRVTAVEQYAKDAFPTDQVYQPTPGAELRLITCGGTFDQSRLSYRDNIVVYAIGQ